MDFDYDGEAYYEQENYYDTNGNIKKYEILPQSTLFNQLEDLVGKTMEMTAMPFGWALLLLR